MDSWLCGAQFCYFLTDALCTGVWQALGEYQLPELQTLAASLKSTVLSSRAPSTTSKYIYAFTWWRSRAHAHAEIVVFAVIVPEGRFEVL